VIPRIDGVVLIEDKDVNVIALECAVAARSDTIPQLARSICLLHSNVNFELITEPFSSSYVGGTKHLDDFYSKRLFEIVEMTFPNTASRPLTYQARQP
jgi:hypothetical protein